MLNFLAKLLKVLNSERSPGQLAAAVSLAAIIGMTPLYSLHNLFVLFLVLFFRVNLTVFLLCWPLFTVLGLLISPLAEAVGLNILQAQSLAPLWELFYNSLIGRWSNFYYTRVMGSFVIALSSAILLYPLSTRLIVKYREKWLKNFEKIPIVQMLKASKFWMLYERLRGNS